MLQVLSLKLFWGVSLSVKGQLYFHSIGKIDIDRELLKILVTLVILLINASLSTEVFTFRMDADYIM